MGGASGVKDLVFRAYRAGARTVSVHVKGNNKHWSELQNSISFYKTCNPHLSDIYCIRRAYWGWLYIKARSRCLGVAASPIVFTSTLILLWLLA
jgi:hypothetical protein